MLLHPTQVNVEEFEVNGFTHFALSYGNIRVSSFVQEGDGMGWHMYQTFEVLDNDPNVRRSAVLRELGREFGSRYAEERYNLRGRKLTRKETKEIIKQIGLLNEFDWGTL